MANDRMFLLHEPSGYHVYIGKRMGWGWYGIPPAFQKTAQRLFDLVESQEAEGDQDSFVIALEADKRLGILIYEEQGALKERDVRGPFEAP